MAEKQLKTRIQLKIDTEENWSKATNFIPKEGEVIPVDGYGVNFTVGTVNEVTNTFVLTLGKFADEAFGVELPAYVREELIITLNGWY